MRVKLWESSDWPVGRYGSWEARDDGRYLVPELLSGSDYSGCLVHRSNYEEWRAEFAEGEDDWWCAVSGGYATYAIVIDTTRMTEEATEFLDALDSYPLANEERHSDLEMDAQGEAWENWARTDFVRALEKRFEIEDLDLATDRDKLYEVFHNAADRANEYWVNEQGGEMWIKVERVAAKVTPEELLGLTKAARAAMAES